jgi:hypothetical protein
MPESNATAPFWLFLFPLLGDCSDGHTALDGLLVSSSASVRSLLSWIVGLGSPLLLLFESLSSNTISFFFFSSLILLSLSHSFSAPHSEFPLSLARCS